jgi:hypothetical protein
VDFVLRQRRRVGERLADVFLFEVRELRDDLRRCQPVCDEVDDVGDGDSQPADRCPPGEDGRVLRDAIERAFHNVPRIPLYRRIRANPCIDALELGLYQGRRVDGDEAIALSTGGFRALTMNAGGS